ncbi:MAG TPA: flagellar biosynthesis protein FliQ [Candidatus Baltobacteraceae bacterium]|nr:flagellar biosynthesis protein FliQ [Candidatus Baltobacteraceae bacterium]
MGTQQVIDLGQRALQLIVLLSAPVLLAGLVTGLAVSLVQAVTSIQEATLTFVPKLVAVFLALVLCMPWMADLAVRFAAELFGSLGQYAR